MDILRIKLVNDLLDKCLEYKTEQNIVDETYDNFIKSRIDELVKDVDISQPAVIDETKCMARLWNQGKGEKQCSNRRKVGEYCGHHSKELSIQGILRFDDIRKDKPKYDLIKKKNGILEELPWIDPNSINQLQTILDLHSQKIIYATPHLITD